MTMLKSLMNSVLKGYPQIEFQCQRSLHMPCKTTTNKAANLTNKKIPKKEIKLHDNIKLISLKVQEDYKKESNKPVVVMLEWLMAKNKHVHKFADIYLDKGFDVLSVRLRPWQLIWPLKGSQVVAESVLDVLYSSFVQRPLLVHGFSVGGYLWGEVQLKMEKDLEKYSVLVNNVCGAIWDSVVDINETAIGVPQALFPNNAVLRNACRKYILYHMKRFEKEATQHWRRSRESFYRPIVKCPALLLYSATDPIGNPKSYAAVRASYERIGIQIYEKCWDKSPHVAHYAYHKDEYVAHVEMFLEKVGLIQPLEERQKLAL